MTDTAADSANLPDTGQFYQRGNYAPVPDELTEYDLPVKGAIPAELDGWYLRNGPNPRQPTGHWFLGDGMIHGVRIEGGAAKWYRNRWVRTDSFDTPFGVYNGDGSRNLRSAVANTHIVNHAGKTLATWKCAKNSQRIDTKSLAAAHPDIAQAHTSTVLGSRRFLLKGAV